MNVSPPITCKHRPTISFSLLASRTYLRCARNTQHLPVGGLRGVRSSTPSLLQPIQLHHHHPAILQILPTKLYYSTNGRGGGPFKKMSNSSKFGAISSLAFLSFTKSKAILAALKLTKFASLGSMLLSVGAYSTIYGLPFATGMVGLILVHESGHALMMKRLGVPFSPMVFVPFLGAAIAAKEPAKNAYEDALIALGGPALGSVGAFAVWGGGMVTGNQLLLALGDFGFMINLFNLIPVGMLDGGRIGNALSPYVGVMGCGMAGSLIYTGMVSNPIFYLITLGGGYSSGVRLWNDYRGIVDDSLPYNFYNISQGEKAIITGSYFTIVAALCSGMAVNELYKKSPETIRYEQQFQQRRW